MLKTTLVGIMTAALMSTLSIGTGTAFPAAPSPEPQQTQEQEQPAIKNTNESSTGNSYNFDGTGCVYTDENGDGICDYYDYHSANGYGHRHYFADENGDGICDYCTLSSDCGLHENCPSGYSGQPQQHHGSGCGNGSRRGHHR